MNDRGSDRAQGAARRPSLLFVSTRYLFPTDSGGKIRTVNILRGLKGGRFEITLASPFPADGIGGDEAAVAAVCDRFAGWPVAPRGRLYTLGRALTLFDALPVAVASDRSEPGRRVVAEQLALRPDLLVVDFPHAAVLLPARIEAPAVLFTHNVETEIFQRHFQVAADFARRALWRSQTAKMDRFEGGTLRRFDTVIAVSERDAGQFRARYGIERTATIPTGVDLQYFEHRAPAQRGADEAHTVVFTGSMDWLANIDGIGWFLESVWPRISAARPDTRMVVVGRAPPAALVKAARDRGLKWEFTGFVDDVRPYVHAADVFVIPLRVGGGTRIKAYEAMAMGCPVVSTTIGVEGLPLAAGGEYERADAPEAFADAVVRLLGDADRRGALSGRARLHVEEHFSAPRVARVFEDICLGTLERRAVAA